MNFIIFLIVGLIAGALASKIMQGRGLGLVGDTIVGVVGGFLGGIIFGLFGLESTNIIGSIIVSFIGACTLLAIAKYVFNDGKNVFQS